MERQDKTIWSALIGFLVGILVTVMSVAAFFTFIKFKNVIVGNNTESVSDSSGSSDTVLTQETMNKIKTIEDTIGTYYYKTDIDRDAEAVSIYKGIVSSLDDPYSEYYTEDEYKDLMSDTQGVYYGIGAYVSMDKTLNLPRITGTIENSPAEEAGFLANDIIYEVGGENVQGMTLTEVVNLIRGEIGTSVVITVYRETENDYIDIEVTRDEVEAQTVNNTMLDDNIGYLGITEFDSVTPEQFLQAKSELESQNMKALIIDLRSNPGGNLSAVCDIARELLPEGDIVYTVDRDGNREDYTCDGTKEINIPLAVLVNGYSASASEILSGSIQDYGIGTIVGETTYGKGVVQRIFGLQDGTALKLTISNYFTPNGNNINGVGIQPDVEVELDTEAYAEDGSDNQLDKALEILKEQIK